MLLSLLATLALFDSPAPPVPVDGYALHSPDRTLELFVMPDDRYGKAGAQYTLTGPEGERYDVHHDFRLHAARVFDTGQVAGFYEVRLGEGAERSPGSYMVVLALGADGAVVGKDWIPQAHVEGSSGQKSPRPGRLIPLVEAGTFIVETWVQEASGSVWQAYALDGNGSEGAFRAEMGSLSIYAGERAWVRRPFEPMVGAEDAEGARAGTSEGWRFEANADDEANAWRKGRPDDVEVLPGLGLIVECWVLDGGAGEPRIEVLNVLDATGQVVARRVSDAAHLPSRDWYWERDQGSGARDSNPRAPFSDVLRVDAERPRFAERRKGDDGVWGEEVAWEVREVDGSWRVERLEGNAKELVVEAQQPPEPPVAPARPVEVVEHELARIDPVVAPFDVEGGEFAKYQWVAPALFDGALAWEVDPAGILLILRLDGAGRLVCARYDANLRSIGEVALQQADLWQRLGLEPDAWRSHRDTPLAEALGGGRFVLLAPDLRIAIVELTSGGPPAEAGGGATEQSAERAREAAGLALRTAFVGRLDEVAGVAELDISEDARLVSAHELPEDGVLFHVEGGKWYGDRWLIALMADGGAAGASDQARLKLAWFDRSERLEAGPDFAWEEVATLSDGRVVAVEDGDLLRMWSSEGRRLEPVALSMVSPTSGRTTHWDFVVHWSADEVLLVGWKALLLMDLATGATSAVDTDMAALGREPGWSARSDWFVRSADGTVWSRGPNSLYRVANGPGEPNGRVVEASIARHGGLHRPNVAKVLGDGRVVLYDGLEARFTVWDPGSGAVRSIDVDPRLALGLEDAWQVAVLPDGRLSVLADDVVHVELVLELAAGAADDELTRRIQLEQSVWSPDGRFRWEWRYPGVIEVYTANGAHVRTIEQHDRGYWWNSVFGAWFAADGSVWLKEGGMARSHVQHHVRYSPDGVELEVVRATKAFPDGPGTVFDGPLALSGASIYKDPNGPAPREHTFTNLPSGPMAVPESAPDELWVFELETLTLHRYRLPDELVRD